MGRAAHPRRIASARLRHLGADRVALSQGFEAADRPREGEVLDDLLHNHREVVGAFDFFTVPTLTFRLLYCFFVIEHHRRRILHFNTTAHPSGEWIVQQLREAFPLPCPYRYVVFDHDSKFNGEVEAFLKDSGLKAVRTGIRSPRKTASPNDGSVAYAGKCWIT